MTVNVEFSVMLMVVMGIILYMLVYKRFKKKIISKRTKNTQAVEIILLVVLIAAVDFLQFVLPVFSNKFVLNSSEIALIFLFLMVDKLINKRESFLG